MATVRQFAVCCGISFDSGRSVALLNKTMVDVRLRPWSRWCHLLSGSVSVYAVASVCQIFTSWSVSLSLYTVKISVHVHGYFVASFPHLDGTGSVYVSSVCPRFIILSIYVHGTGSVNIRIFLQCTILESPAP